MMLATFADLNWLSIVLATLAYYLLGAVWFTPLFGRAWDRSIGHDRSKADKFGLDYYLVPLVSAALVSIAVSLIITSLPDPSFGAALLVGVVIGLGVAAAISVNNALAPHTPHPYVFGAVVGGYHLVGVVIVAAVIGLSGG
jgi:MFS family permease